MQITYKNKVTLQSNPNIPDENKVTAKDMNEIKSAVNSNEEEQQALNMSVQEIAQNVVNNSQEISNIKEEQTTQNDNIQTNSNNISDLQSNKADKSEIPTDLSQLSNENTKFVNETGLENAILQEKTQRQNADNNLQNQIDAITASTDVIDIVGTYQDLQDYDTSKVKQNDVIKVLQDSTHNNAMSYYRWQNQWIYIGSEGPYYTIGQTDELLQGKANQSDLNQTNTNVTNLAGRVSNNENKIENIEQEQTTQNTNISNNATNIESLQEENESLKKIVSQLPQVEGQGTEVTLENTIEAQFTKFDVEGNSVQDGTPSPDNEVPIKSAGDNENLLPFENINITLEGLTIYSSNGNLYLNGTNSSPIYSSQKLIEFSLPAGTYTSSENVGGRPTSFLRKSSDDSLINDTNRTFTLYEPTNVYLCGYMAPNNYTNYQLNWKLEKGNKATPYSPYGMGSINEKIMNKNWNTSPLQDGSLTNGLPDTNYETCRTTNFIDIKPSTNYAFSINGTLNRVVVSMYDEEKNFIATDGAGGYASSNGLFTTYANAYYIKYRAYNADKQLFLNGKIQLEQGTTATPYVPHEEQDYSIFVQQPFRSIGDVRDCFVKKSDGWYERHMPYIASYNGETLPQDVYNEVDNVKYCNEKSMSTTGQFSIGASVQYIDENNWNDLPCTQAQIDVLENLPSTYKEMTIINSEDETPAYLEVNGIYDLNKLITRVEVIESEV